MLCSRDHGAAAQLGMLRTYIHSPLLVMCMVLPEQADCSNIACEHGCIIEAGWCGQLHIVVTEKLVTNDVSLILENAMRDCEW